MLDLVLDADPEWDSSSADWAAMAERAVRAAVAASAFPQLLDGDREVELSMTLTDDEAVRALNAQWRGKDKPTNVLSFPMSEFDELEASAGDGPPLMLGDIVLAHGVCTREADEKAISIADHAQHLMVHGTLHLLGYDHLEDDEAEAMEALERSALAGIGIADPYREVAG
jgi:probable rRNA maturation factor